MVALAFAYAVFPPSAMGVPSELIIPMSIFENDVDRLKAGLKDCANPNVTDADVLRRHQADLAGTSAPA
jgi:hypothetical protein